MLCPEASQIRILRLNVNVNILRNTKPCDPGGGNLDFNDAAGRKKRSSFFVKGWRLTSHSFGEKGLEYQQEELRESGPGKDLNEFTLNAF